MPGFKQIMKELNVDINGRSIMKDVKISLKEVLETIESMKYNLKPVERNGNLYNPLDNDGEPMTNGELWGAIDFNVAMDKVMMKLQGRFMPKPKVKLIDMTGKKCITCKKGKYMETSLHDDMDGVLHCSKCNALTKRWIEE